jgi:hypothetical protein
VITNDRQRHATRAHLDQFEKVAANLERRSPPGERTKLGQLEIDAVRALADDLRTELDAYERGRPSSRGEPEPGD